MESEEKYLFNDIYDEVVEGLASDADEDNRPLCDSLSHLENQYSDFREIASGGMKRIYKVFDHKLNRFVAFARLHPDSPVELHDPFIREARLTALLEHPNIISVYDIGIDKEGLPFFTMELKAGKTLAEIIKKSNDTSEVLESFVKVCDAVAFAHSKNVLHLDLKPDNIQIGGFGEVIVCDWGLGKILGDKDIEYDQLLFNPDLLNNLTRAGKVVGTPGYMAPEQLNQSLEKTKQTDIYSLGAMLYTILTGKLAFSGDTDEILAKTASGELLEPKLRCDKSSVPISLNAVVLKAMALSPDARYASVEELQKEVQSYLSGKTTQAENAGLLKEAGLFYKRNIVVCNMTLLFMVSLLVIGSSFLVKLQQKNVVLKQEKERAEENFQQAELERDRFRQALDKMYMEKGLATALLRDDYLQLKASFDKVDADVFRNPVKALKEAEEILVEIPNTSKGYDWSRMQLGYIYYLRQQFHLYKKFHFTEEEEKLLLNEVNKINDLKDKNSLSSAASLKELLKLHLSFPYSKGTVLKMLKYDGALRQSKQEHSELVEVVLRGINKNWQGVFVYKESSQELILNGKEFFRVALKPSELSMRGEAFLERVSLIDSLPIRKLNISGTSIGHLWAISDLGVEELKMINVKINDLEPLQHMGNLKRLIVTKGHFSSQELAGVPQHVEVIFE